MPSFSIDFDFEVYCANCNAGLCNQSETTNTYRRSQPCVRVEPCQRCIERAVDDAVAKAIAEHEKNQDNS